MTDLISRQAAIDGIEKRQMNIMRSTDLLDQMRFDGLADALDIIKLLPTAHPEPCGDTVSRKAVLEVFMENADRGVLAYTTAWRNIKDLPSVTPKQRTGKWIKLDMHRGMADHKCTACEQECYVPTCMGEPLYAFCPSCGSYNGG